MTVDLDHLIVFSSIGAPEADELVRLGLTESSPNTHPGQGTANRRFCFENAYLELLWVHNPEEAQSESVRPTQLWERWCGRSSNACPFGVALRPARGSLTAAAPFPSWPYHPVYLPSQVSIDVATDVPLTEPAYFYLGFVSATRMARNERHSLGLNRITGVTIETPRLGARSQATQSIEAKGLLSLQSAPCWKMIITFDGACLGGYKDFHPTLPLAFIW